MGAQWKQKGREAAANAKGRIMTRLSRELMIAARDGADPTMNPRLRMAVEAARKASMTRDTMERAIKKGAGLLDEPVVYETVFYEGFTPHQVPVIVECLTENRNRTAANIKQAFRKGQMASTGAVSWDFARVGAVEATHASGADPEEAAIEAGAQELEPSDEGGTTFYTDPGDVDAVSKALAERGWTLSSARLIWKAKNPVSLDDEAKRTEVEAFLEALDEDDDVQHLYVGLA
ncbi:MAG: YebC/PmpR family DNA-binding transcriptional regulator [Deltaproteobacteria bacterium]|nr:YebC/PmpR family DNA-binding transcriptional regulator [Deltaproteobacteria bacterium]